MCNRTWVIYLLGVFVLSVNVSCKTSAGDTTSKWIGVALVDGGSEFAQYTVQKALEKRGIACYMDGSVAYVVMVPKSRFKEAREVLIQIAPTMKKPPIIVLENGKIPWNTAPPKKKETLELTPW
jgi:hypothetical protein